MAAPASNAAAPSDCGSGGNEVCLAYPALTTGGLLGLLNPVLNLAGFNPVTVSKGLNVAYDLTHRWGPEAVYTYLDTFPYGLAGQQGLTCASAPSVYCRQIPVLSYGFGSLAAADAERALWSAAENGTLTAPGGIPGGPVVVPPQSSDTIVQNYWLNNPLTPNGGIMTRFAPLLNALGIDTSMPPTGYLPSSDPTGPSLSNITASIGWAYNPLSDFPITANPFSLINSFIANLPPIADLADQFSFVSPPLNPLRALWTNAAGTIVSKAFGLTINGPSPAQYDTGFAPSLSWFEQFALQNLPGDVDPTWNDAYLTLAATNYLPTSPTGSACPGGKNSGKCPQNTALPILYPNDVLPFLVNQVLSAVKSPYLLGNPLNDVLGPALRILVNIGYNDVVTPAKLGTTDTGTTTGLTYAQEGYNAYDRTFYQTTPDKPTPFAWFNNPAMTAEETTTAYGDAWKAFTGALQAQFQKPLWGILVPNPDNPPAGAATPAATKVAAAQTVSAPAPAATVTAPVESTPAAQAPPVSAPTVGEPVGTPVANAPAPIRLSVPEVSLALNATSDPEPSAPTGPARRGSRGAQEPADGSPGASQGSDDNGGASGHRGRR
jgi:hypothetical protein